jgi:NADPH-dependent 2,4-dienoyl-CoA reductase/sulfur reductase-like enzyme
MSGTGWERIVENRTFVIVGAGLAGAKAAETLREEGFAGRVVLIGAETERPYERPPLSKGLLLGTAGRDSPYVHDSGWYAAHDVDLRTGTTVTGVDRIGHTVTVSGGERIRYDRLLLATGASPRTLPGVDMEGVLTLRTLADSDRIGAALRPGVRLVIVGAGWIGLEVAAAARERGVSVTVVESATLPLQRVLGDRIAGVFARLHSDHGVDLRLGAKVQGLTDRRVALADGTTLEADAVLVAVGVRPNTDLAERAGLAVDDGVLVDHRLRTSDPDIFAVGDVASVDHPLLHARIRVEHWANALDGGPVAARAMLDRDVRWDRLPYFFTDQYDLGMEYAGWVPPGARPEVVIRGDVDRREFIAFWMIGGRVAAGMNVNVWDVTDAIQALIHAGRNGAHIDPAALADADIPLADVLRSASS